VTPAMKVDENDWTRRSNSRSRSSGGVRMKLHVFCFDLPQPDAFFIKAIRRRPRKLFSMKASSKAARTAAQTNRRLDQP
jgi:hypothetical protein